MVQSGCYDRWWKTALICRYASVEHSTLFSQIYTQVILSRRCSPLHPPSFLQPFWLPHVVFYCPNLWCRAVVWFYSSCCVSSQGWLYFGGGQSDLCVDRSSLYTHLLKFIKTFESHLRKSAINDRPSSRVFGTLVKNSDHSDLVRASEESKVGPSGRTTIFWWLCMVYLRILLILLWSSSVLLA